MKATLTKFFHFSASFSKNNQVIGHNYVLGVTVDSLDEAAESDFTQKIEMALIKKIESRDLGLHVDFLKTVELNDVGILNAFLKEILKSGANAKIRSLSLSRDKKTLTEITVS
jgi:hypothetical protein